jgi:hypothetical protein
MVDAAMNQIDAITGPFATGMTLTAIRRPGSTRQVQRVLPVFDGELVAPREQKPRRSGAF